MISKEVFVETSIFVEIVSTGSGFWPTFPI